MGTEKFMAFKEDGTAYRLKGRILRFLDAEPVSSADKSNMRSSLGITSQGGLGDLLAANNLDDVASKDTAKTNLEIPDIGLQPNQVPLSGMLNSGAWLDFDAFYEEGTWTPSITFGGGSTGITYLEQAGQYTRIGDVCFVRGIVFLSHKGSDGGALKLLGLPLTSSAVGSPTSILNILMSGAAALTSQPIGFVDDGGTGVSLSDYAVTGIADLTEANVTNSTIIRISGTYQIA